MGSDCVSCDGDDSWALPPLRKRKLPLQTLRLEHRALQYAVWHVSRATTNNEYTMNISQNEATFTIASGYRCERRAGSGSRQVREGDWIETICTSGALPSSSYPVVQVARTTRDSPVRHTSHRCIWEVLGSIHARKVTSLEDICLIVHSVRPTRNRTIERPVDIALNEGTTTTNVVLNEVLSWMLSSRTYKTNRDMLFALPPDSDMVRVGRIPLASSNEFHVLRREDGFPARRG